MKKEIAKAVLNAMQDVVERLDASIHLVMDAADDVELQEYKLAIGRAMGEIITSIEWPIFEQYPELTPEALRDASKPAGFYGS